MRFFFFFTSGTLYGTSTLILKRLHHSLKELGPVVSLKRYSNKTKWHICCGRLGENCIFQCQNSPALYSRIVHVGSDL